MHFIDHHNTVMEPEVIPYDHTSLQDQQSIRILTLLPGSHGTPLTCQIAEVKDMLNIPYDALSYAWGNEDFSEVVKICESDNPNRPHRYIPITRNLYNALQHLRTETPRKLWIDSLCINQSDLQEKGHQVTLMGRIYRSAEHVVVWLGEDEAYPRTRALLTQDGRNRWPLTLPEVDLGELVTIPWFSRVWPVQEYVLPQHVSFRLGALSIPAQHLENVVIRTGAYIDGHKELYDQWNSITLLFEYRQLVQERKPNTSDPRLTLVRVFLDLTRSRLCKDSRDRIYGILGIFGSNRMIPDYTLPPQQVYQAFVSQHLEAGDFSILHECCIGIPSVDEQSYVPFFGQSRSHAAYIPFADPLGATYRAGVHQQPNVNIDDDKHISIQGSFVDVVQQKLDFAEDCTIELDSAGLIVSSSHMNSEPAQLPLRGTWGAIYQTIMNCMITDPAEHLLWRKDFELNRISPQFSRAPYPHDGLFDVLTRAIRTDLDTDYDWLSSTGTIRTDAHLRRPRREILLERSLFWTKSGFIGLGTCHMQPGDEVVIFNGDTTPFLLRKDVQADSEKDIHKIVSDCYLYGWMYGPYPDITVAGNPSRRAALSKRVKGFGSKGERESRPAVASRTFIIS